MPRDTFYFTGQVEGDGRPPDITVAWGHEPAQVLINDVVVATPTDCSGLNRLIATLRRARDRMQPSEDVYR